MTGREDLAGDPDTLDPVADADADADEDLFPSWFDEWTEPPPPVPVPWFRNIRVLATLIGIAIVALLISTALLLTLRSPGDFPTGPRITTATTPPGSRPSPTSADSSTAVSTTPTTTASSAPSETAATEEPPPEGPGPEPLAPPSRSAARGSGDDDGPRINVTRSPMSFTPTSAPRP